MLEARLRKKELSPPQRRHVLLRLRVVRYVPRRRKFKGSFHFVIGERVFFPLLVKIRSRFWSCQVFGMSEEEISTISAVCPVAGKFLWGLPNLGLLAPFLRMVLA